MKIYPSDQPFEIHRSVAARSFFPPTVLTDVQPGMTCFQHEIFGPVIAIIEVNIFWEWQRTYEDKKKGLGKTGDIYLNRIFW